MGKMRKRYKIKSRFRFTAFMVLFLIMLIGTGSIILGANSATSMENPIYKEVLIQPGDTLWNLTSEYCDAEADLRDVIFVVCEINQIDASKLQAGQIIKIPVKF